MDVVRGKAHVFGRAHINTDEIIPARYLTTHDEQSLARHVMEDISPEFVSRVQRGDLVIAGEDFGCGSSREHAVWALRGAGVAAVIATTFARIFFRNALNNGFLAVECAGLAEETTDGDEIELDLDAGLVRNHTTGRSREFTPLTPFVHELLEAGGLLPYVARKRDQKSAISNQQSAMSDQRSAISDPLTSDL